MSSLENGLAILRLLNRDRAVLRVGEVCRDLGIPKASASRLLRSLGASGLLEREPNGGYVIGPQALFLGNLFLQRRPLMRLIDGALDALVAEFGFTGYASTLSGRDIVLLRVKQGSYPLRHVREIGTRLPGCRTTMGHALLSRLEDGEVRARLSDPAGDDEGMDAEVLLASLASVRRTRVAAGGSVLTPGITTISAALRDQVSGDLMALAIAFPDSAADRGLRRRMVDAVASKASEVGQVVGDPLWRR